MKLHTRRVEKPWGRDALPACFAASDGRTIGEIWFEDPARSELPLLAKYLFTGDRLSVQVHPSAEQAQESGARCGKAECWYVADADPGALVGFGLNREVSRDELRKAAADGSIEGLLAWRPVHTGEFLFVPGGTIHAICAGLTIVEIQQNCDLTYRLFDYGRPRPVQVDEALAVAHLGPANPDHWRPASGTADQVLVSTPQFTVARISTIEGANLLSDRQRWALPINGSASTHDATADAGECLLLEPGERFELAPDSMVILAAPGALED